MEFLLAKVTLSASFSFCFLSLSLYHLGFACHFLAIFCPAVAFPKLDINTLCRQCWHFSSLTGCFLSFPASPSPGEILLRRDDGKKGKFFLCKHFHFLIKLKYAFVLPLNEWLRDQRRSSTIAMEAFEIEITWNLLTFCGLIDGSGSCWVLRGIQWDWRMLAG